MWLGYGKDVAGIPPISDDNISTNYQFLLPCQVSISCNTTKLKLKINHSNLNLNQCRAGPTNKKGCSVKFRGGEEIMIFKNNYNQGKKRNKVLAHTLIF